MQKLGICLSENAVQDKNIWKPCTGVRASKQCSIFSHHSLHEYLKYSEFKTLIFVKQTKIFRQYAIHCAKCGGRTKLQILTYSSSLSALDSSKCEMFWGLLGVGSVFLKN